MFELKAIEKTHRLTWEELLELQPPLDGVLFQAELSRPTPDQADDLNYEVCWVGSNNRWPIWSAGINGTATTPARTASVLPNPCPAESRLNIPVSARQSTPSAGSRRGPESPQAERLRSRIAEKGCNGF